MGLDIPKTWDAVKAWWGGKWEPYQNEPSSGVVFIGGTQTYHWSAKAARKAWRFIATEWKWIIGVLLTVAGLWIAASKISGPEKAAPTSSVETPNAPPAPATHPDQK